MPYTLASPSPVPLPDGLVVKNGSKRCACVASSIPTPVSDTSSRTWRPASRPGCAATNVFVERRRPDLDAESAARGHGVAGVGGEVEQHLLDLDRVREDERHLGVGVEPDDDVLPDKSTQQRHRVARHLGQIERRRVHLRSAAEREQPARQLGRALGGMLDLEHVRPRRSPGACSAMWSSANPRMAVSKLLKSWATPPASRPIASIFWALPAAAGGGVAR